MKGQINSYEKHKEGYKQSNLSIAKVINPDRDSVDFYRHYRMYNSMSSLVNFFPNSSWLTVGDGKYGQDSIRLKELNPAIEVLPSDISPYLLRKAKEAKIIDDFREENVEFLSFDDEEFDFVFCKEAYHHFLRPAIGIYEMLRVARKGVVLIEPNDQMPYPFLGRFFEWIKKMVKKAIGKEVNHHDKFRFEESGNYVYTLSKREIEKIALGLGLSTIGVNYFNDYFDPNISKGSVGKKSKEYRKFINKVKILNILCFLGIKKHTNMVGVIFKEPIEKDLKEKLEKTGFEIIDLPINPYMQ